MNNPLTIERDERTTSIENAGYRWAYLVHSFGLLAVVAFRSFSSGEQPWDLLSLVLLGGLVTAGYQAFHRVVYKRWVVVMALTMILAAVLAVSIAFFRH